MKKIMSVAVLALFATSSAFAQFANTTTSTSTSKSTTVSNPEGWSTFWVEWNPSTFVYDQNGVDDDSFTGFSIGISKSFPLSQSMPFFAEIGFGAQYSFKTFDSDKIANIIGVDPDDLDDLEKYMKPELKFSMFSVKMPINVVYAFQIPNSTITLLPYVGATMRYNISGKREFEWHLTSKGKDTFGNLKDQDQDVFDKDDMGGSSETWNRFQFGWQLGVKARFNDAFLLGISYGKDFSEIAKKSKISTISISAGFTF